jgi:hypothetical protein
MVSRGPTGWRVVVAALAVALAGLLGPGEPAAAHSADGLPATNLRTRLRSIDPHVPGLRLAVVEAGNRLELTNEGPEEVVVLGYQGEPYLRVGPGGVFENRRSPAAYLNADRQAATPVPDEAGAEAAPVWRRTSDGTVARWHDHRTHWMGAEEPPAAQRAPARRHVVLPEWTVPMRIGDRSVVARGDLVWIPGPSPLPWLLVALALAAAAVTVAVIPRWHRSVAAVVAVLVAVDVAHVVGIGLARAGPPLTRLAAVADAGVVGLVGWVAGGAGVWLLARRRDHGVLAAGVAGLLVALLGGVADLGDLARSQIPFAWPAGVARLLIAVSLGLGLGVVAATVIVTRRYRLLAVPPDAPGPAA